MNTPTDAHRKLACDIHAIAIVGLTANESAQLIADSEALATHALHALRLVCGTTDANKFETALDRECEKVRVLRAELRRLQSIVCPDDFECIDAALAATEDKP